MTAHPMHEKLQKVKGNSQAIGEFCDWLNEQGVFFASYGEDYLEGKYAYRVSMDIQNRLADFYDIDLVALEEEKRDMLRTIREAAS